MKPAFLLSILFGIVSQTVHAQGVFLPSTISARTRIGSADGPLAGTNIYGQMFAGAQADSLSPLGPVVFHVNGIASAGEVVVPGVAAFESAYVQLVAWDSAFWGPTLAEVPPDEIGRTDIVTVLLTRGHFPLGDPVYSPSFTQPAIVPIPEPAVWTLAVLGSVGFWFARGRRR